MEQTQSMMGQDNPYEPQSEEEMLIRQKYLRQPNETKEQREQRNKNVRDMLAKDRDAQIGVHDKVVLNAFEAGKGKR